MSMIADIFPPLSGSNIRWPIGSDEHASTREAIMTMDICGAGYVSAFYVPPHYIDDLYRQQQAFDFVHQGRAQVCSLHFPSRMLKPSEVRPESSNVAVAIDPFDSQPSNGGRLFPSPGSGRSSICMPTFLSGASGRTPPKTLQTTKYQR